jgi:hypothetical protein
MRQLFRDRIRALALACALLGVHAAAPAQAQIASSADDPPLFRIHREPVPGGGELLTVFGRLDGTPDAAPQPGDAAGDIPLVSVLRDTLADPDPENDRLRYLWVHGYTSPSAAQRVASAVPFLNQRTGNRPSGDLSSLPPSLLDLGAPSRELWKSILWTAAQYTFFDPYGALVKSSVRAFRRNGGDYRKAHIIRALAILTLYEADTGATPILGGSELRDIQARLTLAQKTFGGIVDDGYLQRVHEREIASSRDIRGHNWELLRQRVEAEGLYFDPLTMPDGSPTHALVWVARDDVERTRRFNARFLNIRSPWGDTRLRAWTGVTEMRHVDADGALVPDGTAGARAVELIPLALYGLDHPKIPAVLVDFRDHGNPKRREVSRRVVHDITRNVLSLSPYGDLQYFLGRSVYNFVTNRRGMDINQPSRLRSYSQLKLLLTLNASLDPDLAAQTGRLLERVSMNPLQNDVDVERAIAQESYAALLAAARDDGLAALLRRDRQREFARTAHGLPARILLKSATVASLGFYRHREPESDGEQSRRLDTSRRLAYHRRFLKETLASTPVVEVTTDLDDVRRAIEYLMEHGPRTDDRIVSLAAQLFARTRDDTTRTLALDCLARMNTRSARRELLAIYRDPRQDAAWHAAAAVRLRLPAAERAEGDVERRAAQVAAAEAEAEAEVE